MLKRLPKKNGMALLLMVLVLGSVSLGTLSALAISSLNSFMDANDLRTALAARSKVMGCLDETLIQLKKLNTYAPATVVSSNATCTLAVTTPVSGQRLLVVSLVDQGFTRSVHATVTLSPFAVTKVTEP